MDVGVHAAGGEDFPLPGDDFGAGADDDVHAVGDLRVAGLADLEDVAVPERDVRLVDAGVVQDDDVGDDGVRDVLADVPVPGSLAVLAHAVADHLAAAEHHFLAVDGEVLFDLEEQVGVRQADGVAGRRAVQVRVLPAGKIEAHLASSLPVPGPPSGLPPSSGPLTALLSP